MMENVDRAGQEEFIWAMRTRAMMSYEEESSSWRDSKLVEYEEVIHTENRKDNTLYEQHIKALASFVPDEIIANCNDFSVRHLEGSILFVEISGFTELCESYNRLSKGETSKLNQVLNTYIGTFVQSIMSFNGDVIKFGGNDVLAFWKAGLSTKELSLSECIHQALDCALSLQKSHGSYATDIGVFLRTKLCISAGDLLFSLIGTDIMASYVMIGAPMWEVKNFVDLLAHGEILISYSSFDFVNYNEYLFEILESENVVKVHGITRNWRSVQRSLVNEEEYHSSIHLSSSSESNESIHQQNVFELRPSMGLALQNDCFMKNDLRKFILPTVLRSIDMDDSVDNLTEIRSVSVLLFQIEISRIELMDYIETIDKCFTSISEIATALDGALESVHFKEKLFSFIVIFGFRGYKHELDSQRALVCGNRCFVIIQKFQYVKSVSVAVTIGMAFCGVIGHTMRREYSVIGLALNRAEKILSIYSNKICCDKQTFFSSKLEARNFSVLDSKSLKSISYVGPIYEYVNFESCLHNEKLVYNPFPILDRDIEIRTYHRLINSLKNVGRPLNLKRRRQLKRASCLIIKGKPRQGKTRISEEILYTTPSDIPIFRIKLIAADKKLPYQAIRLILAVPMGISEKSSIADREVKISSKLARMPLPELKCALNSIFKVNFEKSHLYISFNDKGKLNVLKKTIKQLCFGCFPKLWVVVIDGGEYIDDDSWPLINTMLETYLLVIVITMGANYQLTPTINSLLRNSRYRILNLKPIDKCFHAGLACQMLNVQGIPAELEMALHSKSNGNPGWIESYLIFLLQQNEIQIVKIPFEDVGTCDLIIPPKEMMSRDVDVMDLRRVADPTSTAFLDQKWKIFKDCYRDSTSKLQDEIQILSNCNQTYAAEVQDRIIKYSMIQTDVLKEGSDSSISSSINGSSISKNIIKSTKEINICRITPGVKLSYVDPEFSQDVRIMKIFDSLTAYEQFILKCSCVIGECFSRDMLLYVMNTIDSRRTALAIKNLFEIGVLGCSAGDFKDYYSNAILNSPRINPHEERIVVCRCIGRQIPDACIFLPNYANCGYLRFKIASFREITYKILTNEQKKDVHSKAIRFLEKKTKKCESCGGSSLVKLMGVRYGQDVFAKNKKVAKLPTELKTSFNVLENWDTFKDTHATKSHSKSVYSMDRSMSIFDKTTKHSYSNVDPTNPYYTTKTYIRKMKDLDSLIRTYSDIDYNGCDCYRILDSMYKQLIEHCIGAEQMDKWYYAVVEYSSLCIDNFNTPLALKILYNAVEVMEENGSKVVKPDHIWKLPYMNAYIYTLIGKARFEVGQVDEALKIIVCALRTYGFNFPYKPDIKIKVMDLFQRFKLKHITYPKAGSKQDYEAEYCDNVAECLVIVCRIFMHLENWCNAELAALFCLEKALQSERNFELILYSYTHMILLAIYRNKISAVLPLEIKALLFGQCYKGSIEANDLIAIFHLYSVIFKARILRGNLIESVDIGSVIQRIYKSLPYKITMQDVIPLYIQILMLIKKYLDAVSIILDIGYSYDDPGNLTWYYALCISFHLDTGLIVLPANMCENFLYTTNSFWRKRDPSAEKRFYTAIWLWHLRNEHFETAIILKNKLEGYWNKPSRKAEDNLVNLFSELYYLEGLILNTINKMDTKYMNTINYDYKEIDIVMNRLEKYSTKYGVISARLYHLKAWFFIIKEDVGTANIFIKKAYKAAEMYGNNYEIEWIQHSESAWAHNMSELQRKFWREHAVVDTIDFRELEDTDCKLAYYTLETPTYL